MSKLSVGFGEPLPDTEDEVIVRDIDVSEIEAVRRHLVSHGDRRPDVFDGTAAS